MLTIKRTKVVLIIAATAFYVLNCSSTAAQKMPAKGDSPLMIEARELAKQFIDKRYPACGASHIYYPELHMSPVDHAHLRELKHVTFDVQSVPLSEADRLNRIQWHGIVTKTVTGPYRDRWKSNGVWGKWDRWKDDGGRKEGVRPYPEEGFIRKDGKWLFDTSDHGYVPLIDFLATFDSPSCADAQGPPEF